MVTGLVTCVTTVQALPIPPRQTRTRTGLVTHVTLWVTQIKTGECVTIQLPPVIVLGYRWTLPVTASVELMLLVSVHGAHASSLPRQLQSSSSEIRQTGNEGFLCCSTKAVEFSPS